MSLRTASGASLGRASGSSFRRRSPVPDDGIDIPDGALDRWLTYATPGNTAAERREVVVIGDSTTFGAGPNPSYSWLQRLRDRAVSAGLADGGKGIFGGGESEIGYDSPEVNGFVSTTFTGSGSQHDTMSGGYFYSGTSGQTLTLRFRTSAFRLWYVESTGAGTFSYAVDGGAAVEVDAHRPSGGPVDKFVYGDGLSANTTHTIVITNTGTTAQLAFAPVNAVGVAIQKHARNGLTFGAQFHAGSITGSHYATRYQAPLGLIPTAVATPQSPTAVDGYAANNTVDASYSTDAQIRPVLAIVHLGFNDLSALASADYSAFTEAIRKFGAACRAASCDGLVVSGQLPYNAKWPTYGAGAFGALRETAAAEGLAFADIFRAINNGRSSLDYTGGEANPHLTKAQYVLQADWLWDAVLAP